MAIYATYLTNRYGFKPKRTQKSEEKKRLRLEYAQTLLAALHISVDVKGNEKFPKKGPSRRT